MVIGNWNLTISYVSKVRLLLDWVYGFVKMVPVYIHFNMHVTMTVFSYVPLNIWIAPMHAHEGSLMFYLLFLLFLLALFPFLFMLQLEFFTFFLPLDPFILLL